MAINLKKGQRVSLGLSRVNVGLGWDVNQSIGADYDLDVSAFMLTEEGRIPTEEYFVFYNNPDSPEKALHHTGDNLTGDGDDDDEVIEVDLSRINPAVREIIFVVTIHEAVDRKQNFGQVRNSYIRIVDALKNEEMMRYELEEDYSIETSIEFGRLYLRNGDWKFEAMGKGYEKDLIYFVEKYKNLDASVSN